MDTLDDIKEQQTETAVLNTQSDISANNHISEQPAEKIDVNKEDGSFHEYASLTKAELVVRLQEIMKNPIEKIDKDAVEALKQQYYRKHKLEIEQHKKGFIENGGTEEDYSILPDEEEINFKALLQTYKEQKSVLIESIEKVKEENLKKKQSLLDQLKAIAESGDVGESLIIFRKLQQEWKSIGAIPQARVNELWKVYNVYMERFYDLIKINNELRDYDFKKNLEQKNILCETAEKLANETDVVIASRMLQKLHEEWREIGPVAREIRDEVWDRFKTASAIVNKKHQDFFAALKTQEEFNLTAKNSLCEIVESIDFSKLNNFRDWDTKTNEIIEYQHQWKNIGFAPRKENIKVYERFRSACDHFFQLKSEFMKASKAELEANFEKKKSLCEKAESLQNDTNWKATTEILIEVQKEWKTIGPVAKKYSDILWKRFVTACDHFFEEKAKTFSSKKIDEITNLNLKQELIDKINSFTKTENSQDSFNHFRELLSLWNTIGHVPFREKDRIFKSFKEAVNKQMDAMNIDAVNRKLISFKDTVEKMVEGDHSNQLFREREKLLRTYDTLKSEIATYENNMGFISAKTKKSDSIVQELERKIKQLKEDRNLIEKKIKLIDESL
jgi:hypothetical protein